MEYIVMSILIASNVFIWLKWKQSEDHVSFLKDAMSCTGQGNIVPYKQADIRFIKTEVQVDKERSTSWLGRSHETERVVVEARQRLLQELLKCDAVKHTWVVRQGPNGDERLVLEVRVIMPVRSKEHIDKTF